MRIASHTQALIYYLIIQVTVLVIFKGLRAEEPKTTCSSALTASAEVVSLEVQIKQIIDTVELPRTMMGFAGTNMEFKLSNSQALAFLRVMSHYKLGLTEMTDKLHEAHSLFPSATVENTIDLVAASMMFQISIAELTESLNQVKNDLKDCHPLTPKLPTNVGCVELSYDELAFFYLVFKNEGWSEGVENFHKIARRYNVTRGVDIADFFKMRKDLGLTWPGVYKLVDQYLNMLVIKTKTAGFIPQETVIKPAISDLIPFIVLMQKINVDFKQLTDEFFKYKVTVDQPRPWDFIEKATAEGEKALALKIAVEKMRAAQEKEKARSGESKPDSAPKPSENVVPFKTVPKPVTKAA